jgi:hypothetical protein
MGIEMGSEAKNAPAVVTRCLAVGLCAVGIYGLVSLVLAELDAIHRSVFKSTLWFGLIFDVLSAAVCVWWLRAAWLGWYHRSAASVRSLCAGWAIVLFLAGVYVDARICGPVTPAATGPIWQYILDACAAFLAASASLLGSRRLVNRLGLADERGALECKHSAENWLKLPAFLLWLGASDLAEKLIPKDHQYPLIPAEPWWGLVACLGPILVAVITFKSSVRLVGPAKSTSATPN